MDPVREITAREKKMLSDHTLFHIPRENAGAKKCSEIKTVETISTSLKEKIITCKARGIKVSHQ